MLGDNVLNFCSVITFAQPDNPVGHVMNADPHALMKIHEDTETVNSVCLMKDLLHVLGDLL
jgi:hypothetical protein